MTIENLVEMLQEMKIPFAYDHFAEGESPKPPFICYLLPGSNNFAADGKVYFKVNEVRLEVYTDFKDLDLESRVEHVLDEHEIFITSRKHGSRAKSFMRSFIVLRWRV